MSATTVTASAKQEMDIKPVGPWRVRGKVVPGFKRGSKLLGTPTANIDPAVFCKTIKEQEQGVFACFAQVGPPGKSSVHKGVLSIGYNPQFKNKERTLEVYLLHDFPEDFYGEELGVVIVAALRPMWVLDSLESLMKAIQNDVKVGGEILDKEPYAQYANDDFFKAKDDKEK